MPPEAPRCQSGFALIAAMLLLLVMTLLSVHLGRVSSRLNMTGAYDMQSAQAAQAARAGIEWGTFQSLSGAACAAATNIGFAGTSLGEFTATVTCIAAAPAVEDGVGINVNTITAVACNQPAAGACPNGGAGDGYVQREMTTVVTF